MDSRNNGRNNNSGQNNNDTFDRMFLGSAGKFSIVIVILAVLYYLWDVYGH